MAQSVHRAGRDGFACSARLGRLLRCVRAVAGENVCTAQRELTPSIDAKGCASETVTPATAAQANKAA